MSKLIALDLARTVGFATCDSAGRVEFGSHKFTNTQGDNWGAYLNEARLWFSTFVLPVDAQVVYELPFVSEKTSQAVARSLFGLAAVLEELCFSWKVSCRNAAIGDVRGHFLEHVPRKRDAIKAAVIAECMGRGFDVGDDDDAADALAVLDYALYCFDRPGLPKVDLLNVGLRK